METFKMRWVPSVVLVFAAVVVDPLVSQSASAADIPADRVVAMYFHRTVRCPTCLKMGSYSEEAVTKGFAQQVKTGKVEFHYVEFQNEQNSARTNGYKVTGPALIVAKISGNKVAEYKNLTDVWSKVGDKQAFIGYVQSNVKDYQK
jgi:hypothetical protein